MLVLHMEKTEFGDAGQNTFQQMVTETIKHLKNLLQMTQTTDKIFSFQF